MLPENPSKALTALLYNAGRNRSSARSGYPCFKTIFSLALPIIYKKEKAIPTYQLQIKQVVDYPRCRIYRQFVRFLMEDRSIRVSGGSGLFYLSVLCSYANFRTSYRRIDGISYTVYSGE